MATVAVPPELWSAFDDELESLIEGNQAADQSYTAGKGMSLASMAVGSVVMRLTKVRAMAQNRDLQGTKTALEKATVKIREAAFASSGDPEGVTLGKNLEILASLISVLDRMENPTSDVKRNDKAVLRGETPQAAAGAGTADDRATGGVYRDLGIVEPDDDPLSCLVDEEDGAGGGRPKMRFLVAPVDPKLAAKEKKLYWGNDGRGHLVCAARNYSALDFSAATSSLLGEGRQHARALQEALLPVRDQDSPISPPTVDTRPVLSPISTTTETATKSPNFIREGEKKGEPEEMVAAKEADKPAEPREDEESKHETFGLDPAMTDTLRKQLRQDAKDDYWPRLTLAYSLEEQGERWADAGNLSASCSAYSEASELFRICSDQLPSEPESLLRQWVTSRRAREVGYTAVTPDIEVLQRCIKMCMGNEGRNSEGVASDEGGPGSCTFPVCYEAHLELGAVLLERGQFERCIQTCRHVLDKHDDDDAETLFSLEQALEALGLSEEARSCAGRASSLLAATP